VKCETKGCLDEAIVRYRFRKEPKKRYACLKCYEELNAFGKADKMEWIK